MKKQVVIIHGGTTFDSQKEYISYLKNKTVTLERIRHHDDWKSGLQKKLGNKYEVLLPRMPNSTNARYKEWEILFKKFLPLLGKNLVLVGHSLGGIFLAKFLSKNNIQNKIKGTILVAAPYDDSVGDESLADFMLPHSLKKFSEQSRQVILIHSKDDPVVPFKQLGKYKKVLRNAKMIILNRRKHFNQEKFPELIKEVKNLFK